MMYDLHTSSGLHSAKKPIHVGEPSEPLFYAPSDSGISAGAVSPEGFCEITKAEILQGIYLGAEDTTLHHRMCSVKEFS